ncbi:hypothetical protein BASA50_000695 [Batrachochytrium salamandrivorans]|uniref:Uncharacterized protein n=1 Tax=Batrachochytrium salamandrivorans TaxID=1357716 RepID=A0ABQ8EVW0_9FUNG|nr:hypothetical protein BASA50_000695 [Batrachochytrium salamandrivorans]
MTQVENESSEYRTTMELANLLAQIELAEGFNSDNSNHQKVMEMLDRIDACLIELETLELNYLVEYSTLPKDCPILGVNYLQAIVKKVKDSLKLPSISLGRIKSRIHTTTSSYVLIVLISLSPYTTNTLKIPKYLSPIATILIPSTIIIV